VRHLDLVALHRKRCLKGPRSQATAANPHVTGLTMGGGNHIGTDPTSRPRRSRGARRHTALPQFRQSRGTRGRQAGRPVSIATPKRVGPADAAGQRHLRGGIISPLGDTFVLHRQEGRSQRAIERPSCPKTDEPSSSAPLCINLQAAKLVVVDTVRRRLRIEQGQCRAIRQQPWPPAGLDARPSTRWYPHFPADHINAS